VGSPALDNDMTTGIAEFGRLTNRPELVAWRNESMIGSAARTPRAMAGSPMSRAATSVSPVRSPHASGSGLHSTVQAPPTLRRDRPHLRNQLLESQFVDLDFLAPLAPQTPRTERATYAGIDCMIRGTFQCWGTANDLIGNDDIEGCGAGGGVQGLALAWNTQTEWRDVRGGRNCAFTCYSTAPSTARRRHR